MLTNRIDEIPPAVCDLEPSCTCVSEILLECEHSVFISKFAILRAVSKHISVHSYRCQSSSTTVCSPHPNTERLRYELLTTRFDYPLLSHRSRPCPFFFPRYSLMLTFSRPLGSPFAYSCCCVFYWIASWNDLSARTNALWSTSAEMDETQRGHYSKVLRKVLY